MFAAGLFFTSTKPMPETESLLRTIYKVPSTPPLTRSRPLGVICLGPARSGIDSLRTTLISLGFRNVSHGLVWWLYDINDCVLLSQLARKKLTGKRITCNKLDHVFGEFDALTDVPAI
jgi:hypothetical protein